MAGEQTTAVSYEKIYDMGTGLIIAKVPLDNHEEGDAGPVDRQHQEQGTA